MRREVSYKTGTLAGTSDFTVIAPIIQGLVPSLDAVTYKSRVKRVLRTLHLGRTAAHENELARVLSDAVERVGRIHSVIITVLEPQDQVMLCVTFDGAWEAYVRVIWQKVSRLLDLIFCNTENYVLGWENSYEKWGTWLRNAQAESAFLYAVPGMTVDDARYLQMQERLQRRITGSSAGNLRVTQLKIPSAEDIAEQSIFGKDDRAGVDPTDAGFSEAMTIVEAGTPPFRHGVRSLVGLYRLADVFPPDTPDGGVLLRAAQELLPEFVRMLQDGNTYQIGIARALRRFEEELNWLRRPLPDPAVRVPLPLPETPDDLLKDRGNVQGGILRSYGDDITDGCLLLLGFASAAGGAALLDALRITWDSETLQPGQFAVNVALTAEGLRTLGLSDEEFRRFPEEFVQGMERRAGLLGDVRVNHPRRWRLPVANWTAGVAAQDVGESDASPRIDMSGVHAIVQLRLRPPAAPLQPQPSSSGALAGRTTLMTEMQRLVDAHADIQALSLQWMRRLTGPTGRTVEHFGFGDGQAQPVLTRAEAGVRYSNQIHIGEVLCGYPNQADNLVDRDPATRDATQELLKDGSFLVIRKLRQDVGLLDEVLKTAALPAAQGGATGPDLPREEYLARMMGRWASGSATPEKPLATVFASAKPNDFHFDNDAQGSTCPFHAHIRRANPRVTRPEPGSRPPRIVRRGMSYGPQHEVGLAPSAHEASLNAERGSVFMVYNASIGEQFEVVQRWLTGGNSSGAYSGQSDPFLGVAEAGRRRYFRFEAKDSAGNARTVRMPLDGSDYLHEEPRPLVRLEWGAYLFAPSKAALVSLHARAAAGPIGRRRRVAWDAEVGEAQIARLRDIEAGSGRQVAALAWKAALEDPEAAVDFTTASIWAAVRERHGGVLSTPFGVLVAERGLVEQVLLDPNQLLTAHGYLPRMQRSFGGIYLGLDAGEPGQPYEKESANCNQAILDLAQDEASRDAIFHAARDATHTAMQVLVDEAMAQALEDAYLHWDQTFDAREIVDPVLATFCELWFGLSTEGGLFRRGRYRWDWQPGEPPSYPGHFLAPSRFFFQPHPSAEVTRFGSLHGVALREAMLEYIAAQRPRLDAAPVSAAVLATPGADVAFAARTIVGAVMGFVPTVDGNLRRILNEWLREGTLWALRARHAGTQASGLGDAMSRLGAEFITALQLRSAPELLWRRALAAHTIGEPGPHQVPVAEGEIVVAALISASQQGLQEAANDVHCTFGGNRRAAEHPTHACPGADAAMAVMLGFFSALVESSLALRVGPGPLTLGIDGLLPPQLGAAGDEVRLGMRTTQMRTLAGPRAQPVPLMVIGDSWLSVWWQPSLVSALRDSGYAAIARFSTLGRRLSEMARDDNLNAVVDYLRNLDPGAGAGPKAILLGGGGNDIVFPSAQPTLTPLYGMLKQGATSVATALDDGKVKAFVGGLFATYVKIIDAIVPLSALPILVHAYDHPIADCRAMPPESPWLYPVFEARGIAPPREKPATGRKDGLPNPVGTAVMGKLIDGLNEMVAALARKYPGRVHQVRLSGTLATDLEADPQSYKQYWRNELHPTKAGFDELAAVCIAKLTELGVTPQALPVNAPPAKAKD